MRCQGRRVYAASEAGVQLGRIRIDIETCERCAGQVKIIVEASNRCIQAPAPPSISPKSAPFGTKGLFFDPFVPIYLSNGLDQCGPCALDINQG